MEEGDLNYDRIIATPDMMGLVGKIAKILGLKGLMPNPKLGTVSPNVGGCCCQISKIRSDSFRAEKNGIVQAGVGKISFGQKIGQKM